MDPTPIPGQLSFSDAQNGSDRAAADVRRPSTAKPEGLTRADLMTAGQVSELLDVPVSTVREWGRNGTLPRVKLGRHVRFLRAQVEAVILGAAGGASGPRVQE